MGFGAYFSRQACRPIRLDPRSQKLPEGAPVEHVVTMKFLLVHNHYQQRGGEDQVFADEAALLESAGHEVLRYTLHNDSIKESGTFAAARRTFWNPVVYDDLVQ